jgi:hypothetical protein
MKAEGPYNCEFNLSALKQIRSKKRSHASMRMVTVSVSNTVKSLRVANGMGA